MGVISHDPDGQLGEPSSWADTAEQHRQARLAALQPQDDDGDDLGLDEKQRAAFQRARGRGPTQSGANTAPLGSRHSPATEFLSSLGEPFTDERRVHIQVHNYGISGEKVSYEATLPAGSYTVDELVAAASQQSLPKGAPFPQPATKKERRQQSSRGHKPSSTQAARHNLPLKPSQIPSAPRAMRDDLHPKPGPVPNKLTKTERYKLNKARRQAEQHEKEVAIAKFEADQYGTERLVNAQQRIRSAAQREFPLQCPKVPPARQPSDPPPPYSSNQFCFNSPPASTPTLNTMPLGIPMASTLPSVLPTAFSTMHQPAQTGSVISTTSQDICHTCNVNIAEIERTTCLQFPTTCPICHHPRALAFPSIERQQPVSTTDPHPLKSPQPTSFPETQPHQQDLGSQNKEANASLARTYLAGNRGQAKDMKALRRSDQVLAQMRKDKAKKRTENKTTDVRTQQEIKEEGEIDEDNGMDPKIEPQDELDVQTVSPFHL